jgi:hypothetical protein
MINLDDIQDNVIENKLSESEIANTDIENDELRKRLTKTLSRYITIKKSLNEAVDAIIND